MACDARRDGSAALNAVAAADQGPAAPSPAVSPVVATATAPGPAADAHAATAAAASARSQAPGIAGAHETAPAVASTRSQGPEVADAREATPAATLRTLDGVAFVVGIVIGIGIFRTPQVVAANSASGTTFMLLWLLGAALMLVGALCYAELGASRPHTGGEYHFLARAWGQPVATLFA